MSTLKKLYYLIDRKTKLKIVGLMIMIMIGSIAELAGVAIILPIVNLAIDVNFENSLWTIIVKEITGYETREQIMVVLILAMIAIYICKNCYLAWMYSRLYKFSADIRKNMAVRLMKAYILQPYQFFLKKNTSELIRSVNSDTAQLYEVVLNCLMVMANGLTSAVLLITLITVNPVMALLVAVLLVLCAGVVLAVVQKKTRFFGKSNQILSGFMIKYLQQTFEGMKEIKVLNNEEYFIRKYGETHQKQTEAVRKYSLANQIPKYLIETVIIIGIMAYLGVNIVWNPNYMEIIPQLAIFVTAAYKLLPSVNAMYAYLNTIIYNRASIDLVYHDVKEADQLAYQNKKRLLSKAMDFQEKIEISHVDYKYDDTEKYVLQDVSFEIPKGKSIALIGTSGGGKTTTVDIILGLLAPVRGKVLVDGIDIADNMEGWQSQIGYIPQNIYLTDGTIKENVALGIPEEDIEEAKVWKALEEAQLKTFVEEMEKGLETEVGERGVRISGGQRQRIGIARALYRNPQVLVFDEATSALDNETEKEVMRAIDGLHGNKTIIMIAHRLSTIENCDMVYKVEKGQISRQK